MNHKNYLFYIVAVGLLLGLPFLSATAQVFKMPPNQEFYVRIAGKILDATSGKPIAYAYLTNSRTKKVIASDTAGYYTTVISTKDTLRVTAIGYVDFLYQKDPDKHGNYYVDLRLTPKSYELAPVTISAPKLRNRYRPLTVRPEYAAEQDWRREMIERGDVRVAPTISSPLALLYEQFGSRPRQQRKLKDLVARRAVERYITARYNRDVVAEQTGLSGDDLTEFMRYCPISDEFILEASDYELAARINRCLSAMRNGE